MYKNVFIALFLSFSIFANAQDSSKIAKKYFAISLQPNYQGLITYAIVEINDKGEVVNRTYMGLVNWLHQIIGIQQSTANPEGRNLLKEVGIEGPDVVGELWKLRYSEYPYDGSPNEKGWAANPRMPSEGQMQMLKKFGMNTINDYVYGFSLLDLLNAMEDPAWVSEYQNK